MNEAPCSCPDTTPRPNIGRRLIALRPWVQTGFLGLWLVPIGRWLHSIPSCVFHCYACPLSSMACPIGLAANYAAVFPVWGTVPFLLLGVLVLAGASVGTLVCGWACPFGFLQDLIAKFHPRKWAIPAWFGGFRYVVLVGLVLLLPAWFGARGILYDEQPVSICRLCPAGALEAGLYYSVVGMLKGQGWIMSWYKVIILILFLGAAVVIYRPWCRIFCPLGGFLALFNRFSVFHLRFEPQHCVECNLCRTRCPVGVKVDERVNVTNCIRCLDCTACSSIVPAIGRPKADAPSPPGRPA